MKSSNHVPKFCKFSNLSPVTSRTHFFVLAMISCSSLRKVTPLTFVFQSRSRRSPSKLYWQMPPWWFSFMAGLGVQGSPRLGEGTLIHAIRSGKRHGSGHRTTPASYSPCPIAIIKEPCGTHLEYHWAHSLPSFKVFDLELPLWRDDWIDQKLLCSFATVHICLVRERIF